MPTTTANNIHRSRRWAMRLRPDPGAACRCLGFFAAVGIIPDRFEMATASEGDLNLEIEFATTVDPQVADRIRAKICALPTLINFEVPPLN